MILWCLFRKIFQRCQCSLTHLYFIKNDKSFFRHNFYLIIFFQKNHYRICMYICFKIIPIFSSVSKLIYTVFYNNVPQIPASQMFFQPVLPHRSKVACAPLSAFSIHIIYPLFFVSYCIALIFVCFSVLYYTFSYESMYFLHLIPVVHLLSKT